MSATRPKRYTIGQLMLWIAVLAGLLALPKILQSPDRVILFGLVGFVSGLVLLSELIDLIFGKVCPVCSRRALRRLARQRHYYRCMSCRAQLKHFGFGPWRDASGPEDAGRYRRRSEAGIWKEFEVPEDLEGSSSGHLLGSKRSRDVLDDLKQAPHKPDSGRRLEEAEKRVRAFLKRRNEIEE